MGYLINNNGGWITKTIRIPEVDVLTLGDTPYILVNGNPGQILFANYIYITADINQTTGYIGYDYIYLQNENIIGVFEEASDFGNGIATDYFNKLTLDVSHPPTLFGVPLKGGKDLLIKFDNNPTAGDGDLLVTIQYKFGS